MQTVAQRIQGELVKLPHGVLVAMYRAYENAQNDDLGKLPHNPANPVGYLPPHAVSEVDLATALAPCLARCGFMRYNQALIEAAREGQKLSGERSLDAAEEGDVECSACGKRYWSAEGHPRIVLCGACVKAGTRRFLPADADTPEPPLGGQRPEGRVTVKRVK